MAITFAQLQDLMRKEGYSFFVAPDRPVLQLRASGSFGIYTVLISVQDEGNFLQFRTSEYLTYPPSHPHSAGIWQTLGTINREKRFLKFSWDASDGEIICYGDVWVMDNQVTQAQFRRMLGNFLPGIDVSYQRIKLAAETGKNLGSEDPQLLAAQKKASDRPALPPELRALLDKLKKRREGNATDALPSNPKPQIKEI